MGLSNNNDKPASSVTDAADGKPTENAPATRSQEHTETSAETVKEDGKREVGSERDATALTVPGSSGDSEKTAAEGTRDQSILEKQEDVSIVAEAGAEKTVEGKEEDVPPPIKTGDAAKDEGAAEEAEDESKYPSGLPLAILTTGLCLTTFVIALDNSIIATAIPRITTQFNSIGDVGWYGSSYLLTQTSLQPSFGKIYSHFSIKWTYLIALFLFEVGSIICAAAPSSTVFIVGRAVAGVGASALFSGGMTIIGFTVPLRKRAIYIAALSSMFGISSVIGPLLGGAFTDKLTWRWCFWINLPIGGIAFAVVLFFFKNPERPSSGLTTMEKIKKIDILGAFFLISAIVCLLLALQWGGFTYSWSDSRVWGCIIGFGLIISIFIFIQFRQQDLATIPPRIFLKNRTVLAACTFSCFLSMALYSHIYFLPFYFQAVRGTSAVDSGIRCIPYLVSVTISSIIVGGSITVIGIYTPFMWASAAIFTVGAGLLHTLQVDSSTGQWIGYQILSGFGAGMGVQIPFIAVQVVLSSADMPVGNALAIFFNSLGGAISISAAQNIFSNTLIKELPKVAPNVDPNLVIHAGATGIRMLVSAENLSGVILAYNKAIVTCFVLPIAVGGIAFLCSLGMEWKSIKGKKLELGGGA